MDVSVIIVNYNVEHFLSQCLISVRAGVAVLEQAGHAAEVFVVDNNSVDGSCAMVRRQFPEVHLIDSKENLGFSRGNNLAIRQSKGRWVLLLNPDTIIQEDTLLKCLEYADARPRLGGLGVPMVDGAGRPISSKRACQRRHLGTFHAVDNKCLLILHMGGRGGQRRHRVPK